jgi:hypothetical protein
VEQRLREVEDVAFSQEARAAELEVELFRTMDAEHERALEEVSALSVCLPDERSVHPWFTLGAVPLCLC